MLKRQPPSNDPEEWLQTHPLSLQIADCSLQISVCSGFESETKSVIESETESEIQYKIVWLLEAKILHINNDHIAE